LYAYYGVRYIISVYRFEHYAGWIALLFADVDSYCHKGASLNRVKVEGYFLLLCNVDNKESLFVIFLAIPYSTDKRYQEARVLLRKSIEGARIRRKMRKLGETGPGDLRILKEDESSELETQRKEKPRKSKAKRK
jgi:hypothetical protein